MSYFHVCCVLLNFRVANSVQQHEDECDIPVILKKEQNQNNRSDVSFLNESVFWTNQFNEWFNRRVSITLQIAQIKIVNWKYT